MYIGSDFFFLVWFAQTSYKRCCGTVEGLLNFKKTPLWSPGLLGTLWDPWSSLPFILHRGCWGPNKENPKKLPGRSIAWLQSDTLVPALGSPKEHPALQLHHTCFPANISQISSLCAFALPLRQSWGITFSRKPSITLRPLFPQGWRRMKQKPAPPGLGSIQT